MLTYGMAATDFFIFLLPVVFCISCIAFYIH